MSIKTQAFVNFYAAIGTLQAYTALDAEAKKLAAQQNISIRFKVKNGPDGVLVFNNGEVDAIPYEKGVKTDIVLSFSKCKKFNDLVNGEKVTPLPLKGFLKLKFLLDENSAFNVLTKKMAELMRKQEFDNAEEKRLSTLLGFNAMARAIVAIGNYDKVGKKSAARIPSGYTLMGIGDEYGIRIKSEVVDGAVKLTFVPTAGENRCRMVFDSIDTAKALIDNKIDAMGCISTGKIGMSGFIPMVQNINNILNLVPSYLS